MIESPDDLRARKKALCSMMWRLACDHDKPLRTSICGNDAYDWRIMVRQCNAIDSVLIGMGESTLPLFDPEDDEPGGEADDGS